jgi:hypothetical protein
MLCMVAGQILDYDAVQDVDQRRFWHNGVDVMRTWYLVRRPPFYLALYSTLLV